MTAILRPGELQIVLRNHPNKIPVYITKSKYDSSDIPDITRHKFLIPSHCLMGEFIYSVRRWIKLRPEQAIFLFIGDTVLCSNVTMQEIYTRHKRLDGMLHVTYASENTFG